MKKIFIKNINQSIVLNENITSIYIENSIIYRELGINIYDCIIYSEDDNVKDFEKKSFIIYNPFEININDSKILKFLIKKIEKEIKQKYLNEIYDIESILFEVIEKSSLDLSVPITFSETIDISKLLSSLSITFMQETECYLELLINYFKILIEFCSVSIIVSFGLINTLTKEEYQKLSEELKMLNLHIFDINFQPKYVKDSIIVDEDLCIL